MLIREATAGDWPAIWSFMGRIVDAGETFSWDRDLSQEDARAYWLRDPPARAVVAGGPALPAVLDVVLPGEEVGDDPALHEPRPVAPGRPRAREGVQLAKGGAPNDRRL